FYDSANKRKEAQAVYQEATTIDPQDLQTPLAFGDFFLAIQRTEAAVTAYKQAEASHPTALLPKQKLAEVYLEQNNLDTAATYIDALLQLNKADVTSRYLSGRLRLAQQHVAEAITILYKVVQERPNLAPAQYTLGL